MTDQPLAAWTQPTAHPSRDGRYPQPASRLHPTDRLPPCGADQVEGRLLRVDRGGLLVDWRVAQLRHPRS